MGAGTGGKISPAVSGWRNSGSIVSLSATPTNNTQQSYSFTNWVGSGTGSYSGTNNVASITMTGPIMEWAYFTQNPVQVTFQTSPAGRTFTVDSITYSAPQTFSWVPGSAHTIATTLTQSGPSGVQYAWSKWSDGGYVSHYIVPSKNATYTATFTTQYYLTMSAGTGGSAHPASGWKNSGTVVPINVTLAKGYTFGSWTGSGTGSYSGTTNPASITMGGPITEAATFTH